MSSLPTLHYADRSPPLAVLAANVICQVPLTINADSSKDKDSEPTLTFTDGVELSGSAGIVRYLARASGEAGNQLLGDSAVASCQVDAWLDFAAAHLVSGSGLEAACLCLNDYLSLRSVLVGYTMTLADIACWAQLQSSLQWDKLRKSVALAHVARWYDFCNRDPALMQIAEVYGPRKMHTRSAVNNKSEDPAAGNKKSKDAGGSFDIDLKNAKMGNVVTRFPPEPSGYLHIGHAKAALLNQHIANMYQGRLLVRFDDTNPSKEKDEYVENIVADIHRLGLKFENFTFTSDYFPQLVECAGKLIKAGHIYADDTPVDQMREERMQGVANKCRSRSIEENLRLWGEMRAGSEEGRKNCLRMKLDIAAGNTALRDPVAFRCNDAHHWRTGHKYKCYPTYDFACPFVDAIEGVTHALRTSEYRDREAQFHWILRLQQEVWPGLPDVAIWDYARLSFVHTVMSKRKLTWFVDTGVVSGWDDPRMPTVQGLLRRGLQLEALREFILSQGASRNQTYQEWDKVWAMNKRVIDPVCPRHTALEEAGLVPVRLVGAPEPAEEIEVPRHQKYPPAGMKKQLRSGSLWLDQVDAQAMSEGEEVTLMAWGNAIIRAVHKGTDGAVVGIDAELHLEGDFKKTKLKLTWLAQNASCPKLELHHYGYLVTKRKLEEEDNFQDYVNNNSLSIIRAIGDVNLCSMAKSEVLQLERRGYYIIDVPYDAQNPHKPIILLNIPDGKAKNMPGI